MMRGGRGRLETIRVMYHDAIMLRSIGNWSRQVKRAVSRDLVKWESRRITCIA